MKASISSLTLHGWNSVSVQVLWGGDLGPWKLSRGPSNHTICTTTQNSAPASSFTEEMDSTAILFIISIDNNTYSMSHSSQQRRIISCGPHREGSYKQDFYTSGVNKLLPRRAGEQMCCEPYGLHCKHSSQPPECESSQRQHVNA